MKTLKSSKTRWLPYVKLGLLHLLFFTVGTAIFILSFQTPLFDQMHVLFYRGIALLIFTCVVMAILFGNFKKIKPKTLFTIRDIILSLVILFSFNLVFFTHLPVTAERSISVFILGYMNHYPEKTFTSAEMSQIFTQKYLTQYGGIQKRFDEQTVSGDVVPSDNGYQISAQGRLLMKIYQVIATVFRIDKKLVSPL